MEKSNSIDLNTYDQLQREILDQAIHENLDLSIISNPNFNGFQMKYILDGMRNKWDISLYATTEFNEDQMGVICSGFHWKIDPTVYANPKLTYSEMRETWKNLVRKSRISAEKL